MISKFYFFKMRRNLISEFIFILILLLNSTIHAQELQWAKSAIGTYKNTGDDIASDLWGNTYVVGGFDQEVTFALNEENETTLESSPGYHLYIANYDNSGILIWAKQIGTADFYSIGTSKIGVDKSGNIYVSNYFYGSATFGIGEPTETTLQNSEQTAIFIAKFDNSGSLLWAKMAGGDGEVDFPVIVIDDSNNTHVTGILSGSATFGAGEINETTLTALGFEDIFIAKYDSNGNLIWAKSAGSTSFYVSATAIAVDGFGNIYVTGVFLRTNYFRSG